MTSASRIAIVADSNEIFRAGLAELFRRELGFTKVLVAGHYDCLMEHLHSHSHAAFAAADLDLPGLLSIESFREIRRVFPTIRLAMVAASTRQKDILLALSTGIHGYLPRTLSASEIAEAVRLIRNGHIYVPDCLAIPAANAGDVAPTLTSALELTPRQRDVLRLMVRGKSNKEIARALSLKEGTVKVHVNAVFRALGVHNRGSAISLSTTIGDIDWIRTMVAAILCFSLQQLDLLSLASAVGDLMPFV
jgi:DNA-binding NarL/FixJ family response regulator